MSLQNSLDQSQESGAGGLPSRRRRSRLVPVIVALVVALVAVGAVVVVRNNRSRAPGPETFRVRRGPLSITASTSGTLQAARMERIRSKVEANVTILYLIPEGTYLTEQDVRDGKVLVELDSSASKERYTRQEITVENSAASLTKAREDHQILLKQDESNIRAAELKVKFAQMELEHYAGKELTAKLNSGTDFTGLSSHPSLGGLALQRKIQLESNVRLAEEELQRATDTVEWTRRLKDKQYVTANELMADELVLKRRQADLEQSKLALDLFLQYELTKEVESRFADWQEQGLALERVRAQANSAEAQSQARLKSAEATHGLEVQQLQKYKLEVDNATIRATRPGLVVYASSGDMFRRMSNPIEEGATVRARQEIIQLPDLSSMEAALKIHESVIKQIEPGQKVVVTVDAMPDLRLQGVVKEVAGLPDAQSFMQDVKVFTTTVTIGGGNSGLRPGMSCAADITIASLEDAVYVPVQAVTVRSGRKACFVVTGKEPEVRPVDTGQADDRFVQITAGLREGELVLLTPPFLPTEGEEAAPAPEEPPEAAVTEKGPGIPQPATDEPATGGPATGQPATAKPATGEPATGEPATTAAEPPAGDREAMMKKMREAGVTPEDFQRWRSGEFTPEDRKKLQALGLTEEQVRNLRPSGGRRPRQEGEAPP